MMKGHIKYAAVGRKTASVYSAINKVLLRKELGFKGVTITDEMEMCALTKVYRYEEMGVKAVNSGIDILLVCHSYANQKKVYNGILKAIEEGRVSIEDINASVKRIMLNKTNNANLMGTITQ